MPTRLHVVLLLVFVISVAGPGGAKSAENDTKHPPKRTVPEVDRGESFVSVITQHTGEPILAIRYPWKRHAHPSVEVRILDKSEVGNRLIRPLFFVHDIFKGDVTMAVYRCEDRSENVAQRAAFSNDDFDFEVFGSRNSLGRPSVCVAGRTKPERHRARAASPQDDGFVDELLGGPPEPETRAAFCFLPTWSVDEQMLYLTLPSEYFPKPGKIRIWFLRDKDIVWTADTTWPGTPE
ncbi:MAG: hypothetical protein ABIK89_07365 [Planctomycetota bacterium]